jgi:CBS domain-containing protein
MSDNGNIIGYVNNLSFFDVISRNLDLDAPVYTNMRTPIKYIDKFASLSDSIIAMRDANIDFLLLEEYNGSKVNIVTLEAVTHKVFNSTVNLIKLIEASNSLDELKAIFEKLPLYVRDNILSGASINTITKLITGVSDTITHKIIGWAIIELGKPPVPFSFIALGSEGREEQTLLTDQDNAIIYSDVDDSLQSVTSEYFLKLGTKICDSLQYIGYNYCSGNIMAKNPKWTQPLFIWKKYFDQWIVTPEPQNLLDAAIFFDSRNIYGDSNIVKDLSDFINKRLTQNPAFFLHMAKVCMNYKTPLGMFGKIQTESSEEHVNSLNIKSPLRVIVNLLRLYSLKYKLNETNSLRRLIKLYETNNLSYDFYRDINYAYNYMLALQFKTQTSAYSKGQAIDNYLRLSDLSSIEVSTLKNVFNHLSEFQIKIKNDFGIKE